MLIGSRAIKHWFPNFPREPKDTDYAIIEFPATIPVPYTEGRIEYLINPILFEYNYGESICLPNNLYTLKISHTIGWKLENNSWDKHVFDIVWLKDKECELNRPLFDKLYAYWEKIHGPNKRSNLNMSSEDFFNNAVHYPIPHDDIHEILITHPFFNSQKEPTYKKILKGEVDVCMEKFKALSEEDKYKVVVEEVMVMALERWSKIGYLHAYYRMLKKFVREHAKLEEAIWILENWKKLIKAPFNFKQYLDEQIKKHREYTPV